MSPAPALLASSDVTALHDLLLAHPGWPADAVALEVPTVTQVRPSTLTWKLTGTAAADHLMPTVFTTVAVVKLTA